MKTTPYELAGNRKKWEIQMGGTPACVEATP